MATELVTTMTAHLKSERDLVDAMFVRKNAALAHAIDVRCTELLVRRRELIGRLKAHIEQAHDERALPAAFALP